jgi:hypothetical protein
MGTEVAEMKIFDHKGNLIENGDKIRHIHFDTAFTGKVTGFMGRSVMAKFRHGEGVYEPSCLEVQMVTKTQRF